MNLFPSLLYGLSVFPACLSGIKDVDSHVEPAVVISGAASPSWSILPFSFTSAALSAFLCKLKQLHRNTWDLNESISLGTETA